MISMEQDKVRLEGKRKVGMKLYRKAKYGKELKDMERVMRKRKRRTLKENGEKGMKRRN